MSSRPRPIGVVGDESTPTKVDIKASHPILPGTYVYIRFRVRNPVKDAEEEREVVGMIGSTVYKSLVPIVVTPSSGQLEGYYYASDLKRESHMTALVVADITGGRAQFPKYPPPPETPVHPAGEEHLKVVYGCAADSGVRVGALVGFEELEIRVDVNALPKHLLITGTTGSGKSNLVAILADRIARIGGSVVIFDVHGEYRDLRGDSPVKSYEAAINPLKVPPRLLVSFIVPEAGATKQRRILTRSLRRLNERIRDEARKDRKSYVEAVKGLYESEAKSRKRLPNRETPEEAVGSADMYRELLKSELRKVSTDSKVIEAVEDKIDYFFETHRVSLEGLDVSDIARPGVVVVVDVSALGDEERDCMLKVIAEDLLRSLKEKLIPPTLLVVEEAHAFLKQNVSTESKRALQRFIREGRKFGGMLAIVSQRPRALDVDVVSQVQNFAFLRLVQEADRSAVMGLADVLGKEYSDLMPSLPPGHCVLVGEWVRWYPAYVRVDLHKGKRVGATPDVVGVWRKRIEASESRQREYESLAREWEGN